MNGFEPWLGDATVSEGLWRFERPMDVHSDPYLLDHVVEGLPVFPAAYLVGLMTQAAHRVQPHLQVRGVRNVRFVQAARFKGPRGLTFAVTVKTSPLEPGWFPVEISSRMAPPRPGLPPILRTHASGEVCLGAPEAPTGRFQPLDFSGAADYAELYALPREIQHGPAFLAGRRYRRPSGDQLLATVAPPSHSWGWRPAPDAPGWPAALLNAILHVAFSLGVMCSERTVLPLELESATLHEVPTGEVQVLARLKSSQEGRHVFHVASWDARGQPVGIFRGFAVQQVP
jgi:hypothetical protein